MIPYLRNLRIGARVIKTGISIILSLYLATWLGLPAPVFAGIGASFSVLPTVYRSFLSLKEQISANLYGAGVAILLVLSFGNHPFVVGLGAIITILITLKTKNENHIGTALVTMVVIMEVREDHFIMYATLRFLTIMLGIIVAFVLNMAILPPKYEGKLFFQIRNTTIRILEELKRCSHTNFEYAMLKKDIDEIKEELVNVHQTYLFFQDDRHFYKKRELDKARKIIIFRQFISTTRRSLEVLRKIHRSEDDFLLMPEFFQVETRNQLDILIKQHYRMINSYYDKIDDKKVFDSTNLSKLVQLHTELRNMKDQDEIAIFHMLTLISVMFEYGEHLQHLQILIHSYQHYHEKNHSQRSKA